MPFLSGSHATALGAVGPGLIWGLRFEPEGDAQEIHSCDPPAGDTGEADGGGFRWLHLNLAHQGTRDWIDHAHELPAGVRELLLSPDTHQRAVVEGQVVGCVIHDFERDFADRDDPHANLRVGAIRLAIAPGLFLTTRVHPIRSADIVRQRMREGARPADSGAALDLLVGAISQTIGDTVQRLSEEIRAAEDAFLDGHEPPESRSLMKLRRRLARIHRLLDGLHGVFRRLETDADTPAVLQPYAEKLSQRLASLDRDVLAALGELRLLREEIDIQTDQRTNQNLYLLSIMTALMLPATLVTGVFGMNTGDLPLTGGGGSWLAILLVIGSAAGAYALLRWMGFIRR